MAQTIKNIYKNVKFWVGPAIEEGYYYDFDLGDYIQLGEDEDKSGEKILRSNVLNKIN